MNDEIKNIFNLNEKNTKEKFAYKKIITIIPQLYKYCEINKKFISPDKFLNYVYRGQRFYDPNNDYIPLSHQNSDIYSPHWFLTNITNTQFYASKINNSSNNNNPIILRRRLLNITNENEHNYFININDNEQPQKLDIKLLTILFDILHIYWYSKNIIKQNKVMLPSILNGSLNEVSFENLKRCYGFNELNCRASQYSMDRFICNDMVKIFIILEKYINSNQKFSHNCIIIGYHSDELCNLNNSDLFNSEIIIRGDLFNTTNKGYKIFSPLVIEDIMTFPSDAQERNIPGEVYVPTEVYVQNIELQNLINPENNLIYQEEYTSRNNSHYSLQPEHYGGSIIDIDDKLFKIYPKKFIELTHTNYYEQLEKKNYDIIFSDNNNYYITEKTYNIIKNNSLNNSQSFLNPLNKNLSEKKYVLKKIPTHKSDFNIYEQNNKHIQNV